MTEYQSKRICECLDNEHKLTDWEYDFIHSLAKGEAYELSEKQNSILNRIAQKVAFE